SMAQIVTPGLLALGANVIYTATAPKAIDGVGFRSLPDLLAEADIVSLHTPLTASTAKLMDRERLAMMQPGAILINTARGGLVDQSALIDALRSGQLSAAGLDVFAAEPVVDDPVLSLGKHLGLPPLPWPPRTNFHPRP